LRAELRRKARDRQAAAASQDQAEESDATEEKKRFSKISLSREEVRRKRQVTGGRTTRVGRPRGGMKVVARIGEGLRREIERGRRPRVRVGDG